MVRPNGKWTPVVPDDRQAASTRGAIKARPYRRRPWSFLRAGDSSNEAPEAVPPMNASGKDQGYLSRTSWRQGGVYTVGAAASRAFCATVGLWHALRAVRPRSACQSHHRYGRAWWQPDYRCSSRVVTENSAGTSSQ
jgi:hypothetical protein